MKGKTILKKTIWILLKTLGLIFAGALVLLLTVAALVWTHPKESWALVSEHFFPPDLKITWDGLDLQLRRLPGFEFSFRGDLRGLHIRKGSPGLDLPVELVRWHILLRPRRESEKILLEEVTVKATQDLWFHSGPPPQNEALPEQSPSEKVHASLQMLRRSKNFKIHNFDIEIQRFQWVSSAGKTLFFTARLLRSDTTPEDRVDFSLGMLLPAPSPASVFAQGRLSLDRFGTPSPFLETQLEVLGWGLETRQRLRFQTVGPDTLMQSSGLLRYHKGKMKFRLLPELSLRLTTAQADLFLRTQIRGLPAPLSTLQHVQASVSVPFSRGVLWSERPSSFSIKAPLALFFIDKNMRPPLEKACQCRIPESLQLDLQGRAWLRDLLGHPRVSRKVLETRLSLESVQNRLLSLALSASLDIYKNRRDYLLEPFVDGSLFVHSFRGLRNFLDAKNILIPAPLSSLEGTLALAAQGPIRSAPEIFEFPLKAQVRLASPNQKVDLDSTALVRLGSHAESLDLKLRCLIRDLQLELPPLNPVGGLPRVTPDTRILQKPRAPASAKKSLRLGLEFEVVTAKPGAIRLLSKFARPYLPLSLSLGANERKDTTGFIQTEPFKVEYLRRVVQVEKMRVGLDEAEKKILPVDGLLRMDQGEYQIYIQFGGTLKEPQMILSSVPYLPQNEIISVLLYGRTTDQLVSADAKTAGNFAAAMADRAIGIFGLWAFAATPIRSFSYNPLTKVYAASIMITDDLSADIGTNWEEATTLELRKRVSRRWMLTASWAPNEEGGTEEKLVLQWEKRF